ncbi:uncharacterized protein METZ01_LOCUS203945 [marine metagenome]|uniref:Uncharacterized protein n=1 Tax=marine metagenome TaxID=408172 RepID=A0A382EMA9_9ZZZZ
MHGVRANMASGLASARGSKFFHSSGSLSFAQRLQVGALLFNSVFPLCSRGLLRVT